MKRGVMNGSCRYFGRPVPPAPVFEDERALLKHLLQVVYNQTCNADFTHLTETPLESSHLQLSTVTVAQGKSLLSLGGASVQMRATYALIVIERFSTADVAEILNCTEIDVRDYVKRVRNQLGLTFPTLEQ